MDDLRWTLKAAEELSETTKALIKCQQFGPYNVAPDASDSNITEFEKELMQALVCANQSLRHSGSVSGLLQNLLSQIPQQVQDEILDKIQQYHTIYRY